MAHRVLAGPIVIDFVVSLRLSLHNSSCFFCANYFCDSLVLLLFVNFKSWCNVNEFKLNSDSSPLLFCKSKHESEKKLTHRRKDRNGTGREASSAEGAPMTVGTSRLFAMPPSRGEEDPRDRKRTPRLTRSLMPLSAKAFRDREIRDHKANLNRRPRAPAN